jgi:hypothetical protein
VGEGLDLEQGVRKAMDYLVLYSHHGVVRDAGPFRDKQDAIKDACRLRRVLLSFDLEIWSDGERILDHEAIKDVCDS